jgi:hypothetical protein
MSNENVCKDALIKNWENKVNIIKEIHTLETELLGKIETHAQELTDDGSISIPFKKSELIAKIETLSKRRQQHMQDLENILTNSQCNLAQSRQNLADQTTMIKIVGEELDRAEKTIADLEDVRNSRKRMVEITDYEKKRYKAHKDIFKNVAFCGLGVLMSVFLSNKGYPTIGKIGITLSIVVGLILTARKILDNSQRDSMRWDRYSFGSSSPSLKPNTQSVYEYDVQSLTKLKGQIENKAKNEINQF